MAVGAGEGRGMDVHLNTLYYVNSFLVQILCFNSTNVLLNPFTNSMV